MGQEATEAETVFKELEREEADATMKVRNYKRGSTGTRRERDKESQRLGQADNRQGHKDKDTDTTGQSNKVRGREPERSRQTDI